MRLPIALLLLTLCAGLVRAQDPAPPGIDQKAKAVREQKAKIVELEKQLADLKKQYSTAVEELRAELKKLADELGVPLPDPKPPTPPPPADPLAAKLKTAFDGDPAQLDVRKGHAKDLAELYRQAAKLTADPAVTTSGELLGKVRDAAGTLVGADALRECRKVVGAELAMLLPTDDTLTDDQRKAVAALFAKLAGILDSLGG
jgi:hypothetical protein